MLHHAADLAVLALAQGDREPAVRALLAVDLDLHGLVVHVVDGDALAQRLELIVGGRAVDAHAVAAGPAGRGQLQLALDLAVVGQEQQPSEVRSSRPTDITRGMSSGSESKTVGRPSSSCSVVTRPAGLW
jgi:DNA-binding NarL/FixJ family response regulator